ncbi:MAG: Tpl protein [Candidatus Cloacimonetes bacterium HGW-Cloacimonetes-1]|jgi:cell fate regulator YaaT (PSP1 superfamily)|nr:MAG: Tpl protein [Candidatus Cloacimonetes bacterium HGW-Cloacimonetes-1]
MLDYIEVEFRSGRMGYYQNSRELPVQPEDMVIVEVERGEDLAQVVHMCVDVAEVEAQSGDSKILNIIRIVGDAELERLNNIVLEEEKASKIFVETVTRYPFEMKLIEAVYQYDGNKLTFFFTADGRIDFRLFVRELATVFKTRIELHQTTGRDEAKRLGGFGMCGNQYCCSTYLKKFNQVTIKMAKDQNLAGNLSKISGPCGRLLCCLNYEEDFYIEEAKGFPIIGMCVEVEGKRMVVFKIDVMSHKVFLTNDLQEMISLDIADFNKLKVLDIPIIEKC